MLYLKHDVFQPASVIICIGWLSLVCDRLRWKRGAHASYACMHLYQLDDILPGQVQLLGHAVFFTSDRSALGGDALFLDWVVRAFLGQIKGRVRPQ